MQTIWLEFQRETGGVAALGSDVTFFIDGRWGATRRLEEVHAQVAKLRELRPHLRDLLFIGYTIAGRSHIRDVPHVRMNDWEAPAWAENDRGLTRHPSVLV